MYGCRVIVILVSRGIANGMTLSVKPFSNSKQYYTNHHI